MAIIDGGMRCIVRCLSSYRVLASAHSPRALLATTLRINEDQQWNGAWRWSDLERAGTLRTQITTAKYTVYLKDTAFCNNLE